MKKLLHIFKWEDMKIFIYLNNFPKFFKNWNSDLLQYVAKKKEIKIALQFI